MNNRLAASLAAAAALGAAQPADAVDSVSLEVGSGDKTNMARIGAQWKWQSRWFDTGSWHLGGYWDLQLGYWRGDNSAGGNVSLVDAGLTPTFRVQGSAPTGPYLEAAIGFHYLTSKRIHANKRFGTNFNFGDHVGAGVRFGERGRYDLGVRLQHLSNGGIKQPNPGINFAQLRFQYHFD
jgi:opacity protein-like surface antigen